MKLLLSTLTLLLALNSNAELIGGKVKENEPYFRITLSEYLSNYESEYSEYLSSNDVRMAINVKASHNSIFHVFLSLKVAGFENYCGDHLDLDLGKNCSESDKEIKH